MFFDQDLHNITGFSNWTKAWTAWVSSNKGLGLPTKVCLASFNKKQNLFLRKSWIAMRLVTTNSWTHIFISGHSKLIGNFPLSNPVETWLPVCLPACLPSCLPAFLPAGIAHASSWWARSNQSCMGTDRLQTYFCFVASYVRMHLFENTLNQLT